MKYLSVLVLLIGLTSKAQVETIGLGTACSTAAALSTFELRKAAYPFDWIITDFPSLYSTIQENFSDFLNPTHFRVREDKHGVINKNGITFVHDFPTILYQGNDIGNEDIINEGVLIKETVLQENWLEALPQVTAKYMRRIQRFRNVCNGTNKVYFLRHFSMDREQALQFRNLLIKLYPRLDFTLVVIGNHAGYEQPWGYAKIKNYYLNDTQQWNDVREWKRILLDLGLIDNTRLHDIEQLQERYAQNLCGYCDYCIKKRS